MNSDWSFNIDDSNARLTVPPDDVRLPVQEAANTLREATDACRKAALDLGVAIRTSSGAGYGTNWMVDTAGLSRADLERVLRGEELF
ncbi:hypothetical protein [Pseudarthrobacter sp. IC2-21]|uniref:hypothetical protein n=1 Tax=Pseudarthrobacter sp. IC2-21 TaxID=3092262 RepID=UPI002A6A8C2C|nr:hypothetical protein [Pseudarthrobacter sp. IC2-21]